MPFNKLMREIESRAKETKKIFIVPTRTGLIYIGVNFTLFLIGLIYANNLTLLLSFCLFSVLLLIMFKTHAELENYRPGKLSFISASPEEGPGLSVFPVKGRESFELLSKKDTYPLAKDPQRKGFFRLQKAERGKLEINHVKVHTSGESGFFHVWTYRRINACLYVYPSKTRGKNEDLFSFNQEKSDSGQFREHDKYQFGESSSRINWKVYAKSSQLLVKRYEDVYPQGILIDVETSGANSEEKTSRAAWKVDQAFKKGAPWELKTKSGKLQLASGFSHWKKCMEILSEYK